MTRDTAPRATSRPRAKLKAVSLHIGLNAVDPKHYEGWGGELSACEHDAGDMAAIGESQGMKGETLLTKSATRSSVLKAIRNATGKLAGGDLFFLTYSGHGGQVPDVSGDESDKMDETWCLYDGELIDDEIYFELGRFAAGVRILMLSDSCHSGTVARALPPIADASRPSARSKLMPPAIARRVYEKHRSLYDKLQTDLVKRAGKSSFASQVLAARSRRHAAIANDIQPAVILISGCQDNQTSMDGERNGAFTEQLLHVWNNGAYKGNYAKFHARIGQRLPSSQSPNLFTLGPVAGFLTQKPFTV